MARQDDSETLTLQRDPTAGLRGDPALSPIVNIHTGHVSGYRVPWTDARLRRLALTDPIAVIGRRIRLFCGAPPAGTTAFDGFLDDLIDVVEQAGLPRRAFAVELDEANCLGELDSALDLAERARLNGFGVVLSGFGAPLGAMRLLDLLPIDTLLLNSALIAGIERNPLHQTLIGGMVGLAQSRGFRIGAAGVETPETLFVCRELCCEIIEGPIAPAVPGPIGTLPEQYDTLAVVIGSDRRSGREDHELLSTMIERLDALRVSMPVVDAVNRFRADRAVGFFPVIDEVGHPIGLLRHQAIDRFLYTAYGYCLLSNKSIGASLEAFVSTCPVVDVHTRLEHVIDVFSKVQGSEGVIVTGNGHYLGMVSARSLIFLMNQRRLAQAREQNPLTKLPGNAMIVEYASRALADTAQPYALAYFDFDNFKPFNDHYGFRTGDRAILMFGEIAKTLVADLDGFVGHIGGDDFFVGLAGMDWPESSAVLRAIIAKFATDAQSLYDAETREAGYLDGKDRDGKLRRFPLLGVSSATVDLRPGRAVQSLDHLTELIAGAKSVAKHAEDHLARIEVA